MARRQNQAIVSPERDLRDVGTSISIEMSPLKTRDGGDSRHMVLLSEIHEKKVVGLTNSRGTEFLSVHGGGFSSEPQSDHRHPDALGEEIRDNGPLGERLEATRRSGFGIFWATTVWL